MRPLATMRQALQDDALLGQVLAGESWRAWRTLLVALMGEKLTKPERRVFAGLTGREREPRERVEEFWGVVGRRGGKSRAMATLAAYLGGLCDHTDKLALGERGVIPVLAPTQKQAGVVFNYIAAIFNEVPTLAELIDGPPTANTLSLTNGVDIEVRPASFRTVRSMTAVAAIGDEAAFWRSDESANPDTEILNALRPALATTGGPLVVISSPYARRGEVWNAYRDHYGLNGDPLILVAHGSSRTLNPSLSQKVVDRAIARDPAAASAEYLATFRTDVEALLTREAVDAVTIPGRFELPTLLGTRHVAFCDPSGGSADSFTLAIAHAENGNAVLDAVRERRPPFSPDGVVAEFAALLKSYGLNSVTGDRYAGEWPRERFRAHGINYQTAEKTASDLFLELLPIINAGRVELLDHARLTAQLVALERRTSRTGKDLISHPPGGHDDIVVAFAGAVTIAIGDRPLIVSDEALELSWVPMPWTAQRPFLDHEVMQ